MPDTAPVASLQPADTPATDGGAATQQVEAGAPSGDTSGSAAKATAAKARSPRRRKPAEPTAAEAADLFEAGALVAGPSEATQDAPPRPRGRPRRQNSPPEAALAKPVLPEAVLLEAGAPDHGAPKPAAAEAVGPEPGQNPDTPAPLATPHSDGDAAPASTAPPTPESAAAAGAQGTAADRALQDVAPPAADRTQGPPVIGAAEAGLATINPHPIRATDRPDNYLYHLTSPAEAQILMQDGLPYSVDDPLIFTERGGIPYWMALLAEDVDDILDGPVAVAVLRVRRRAVQNYLEPDADSTRAAQAQCFLLTGVPGLAPPPPPRTRVAEPASPVERGTGVEIAGTVKWYNPRKGFGFITPGGGGKDVFVHASTLERSGLSQLSDGQGVRMQVVQGAKGPEAATLTLG